LLEVFFITDVTH